MYMFPNTLAGWHEATSYFAVRIGVVIGVCIDQTQRVRANLPRLVEAHDLYAV